MNLVARIKTWILQEDVSSSDLNAEFDNVLNNLDSAHIVGDSASVGQMQTQVSPGAVGSESLATNVQGEIERLRYVIQRILGSSAPYWYSTPPTDLSVIKNLFPSLASIQNGVSSGAVDANGQPMWLIPDGTTNRVTLKGSVTPFSYYVNGVLYTLNSDISLTGLTVATGSNNTALIDKNPIGSSYTNNAFTKSGCEEDSPDIVPDQLGALTSQQIGSYIALKTIGSAISAKDGTPICFKLGAEYAIGWLRGSGSRLENCLRGFFFSNVNASFPRVGFADGDTVTLMNLAYIFVTTSSTLDVTYNRPQVGANTPSTPASGDYWYDTVNNQWKKYNGSSFALANATYAGMCAQNTTATICARSTDPISSYSREHSIFLHRDAASNDKVVSGQAGSISVYGSTLNFTDFSLDFSIARDKEGTLASGDILFFYLSKTGVQLISNLAPNKRMDLGGYYHPSKPYRCLAACYTSNGSQFDYAIKNCKDVSRLSTRISSAAITATASTSGSTAVMTIKRIFRGGKFKIYLSNAPGPFGLSQASASNGSNVLTTGSLNLAVTDEAGNAILTDLGIVSNVGLPSGGVAQFPAAGAFMNAAIGELSGFQTIAVSLTLTSASGTPTTTITGHLVVEETF